LLRSSLLPLSIWQRRARRDTRVKGCYNQTETLPNAAFAVAPAEAGNASVVDRGGQAGDILCLQEERRVGNDNTLKWSASACKSRRARSERISCAPPCGFTNTPTTGWRSSTARTAWPTTTRKEISTMTPNRLREPLRQPAYGFMDNAARCPQPHRPHHHRSGQLMRYKDRPT